MIQPPLLFRPILTPKNPITISGFLYSHFFFSCSPTFKIRNLFIYSKLLLFYSILHFFVVSFQPHLLFILSPYLFALLSFLLCNVRATISYDEQPNLNRNPFRLSSSQQTHTHISARAGSNGNRKGDRIEEAPLF